MKRREKVWNKIKKWRKECGDGLDRLVIVMIQNGACAGSSVWPGHWAVRPIVFLPSSPPPSPPPPFPFVFPREQRREGKERGFVATFIRPSQPDELFTTTGRRRMRSCAHPTWLLELTVVSWWPSIRFDGFFSDSYSFIPFPTASPDTSTRRVGHRQKKYGGRCERDIMMRKMASRIPDFVLEKVQHAKLLHFFALEIARATIRASNNYRRPWNEAESNKWDHILRHNIEIRFQEFSRA